MTISGKAWSGFIAALRRVNDAAADAVAKYIAGHGTETPEERRALVDYTYAVATKYGEGAAELACEMYDAAAAASGVRVPPAEPAPTATYGETAKAVNGTLKTENPEVVSGAVGRLVKMAGVDTTMQNAIRDGAEWAWVPQGETCAFCLTLASRGWQKASKKVLKGGHAEHIHANCDCTFAIRFDNESGVAGYDPERYRKMYEDAEGSTPQEKINSLRREMYVESKDNNHLSTITKSFVDKTEEWLNRQLSEPKVDLHPARVTLNGAIYEVNGHSVKVDPSEAEIAAAQMMSSYTGERVTMMPKFSGNIQGVSAPDFILGESEKWDHKALMGQSKDAIRNAIKGREKQANKFVIEIGQYKLPDEEVMAQAERVFSAFNTKFVETIVVTKENKIIKVLDKAVE